MIEKTQEVDHYTILILSTTFSYNNFSIVNNNNNNNNNKLINNKQNYNNKYFFLYKLIVKVYHVPLLHLIGMLNSLKYLLKFLL